MAPLDEAETMRCTGRRLPCAPASLLIQRLRREFGGAGWTLAY
jgi:hypothetical protein